MISIQASAILPGPPPRRQGHSHAPPRIHYGGSSPLLPLLLRLLRLLRRLLLRLTKEIYRVVRERLYRRGGARLAEQRVRGRQPRALPRG
jgi:hypothetical protein